MSEDVRGERKSAAMTTQSEIVVPETFDQPSEEVSADDYVHPRHSNNPRVTSNYLEPQHADGEEDEETLETESQSVFLSLVKQLGYGMDLTRIVLPTFVLEPRSFLETACDFICHPFLIEEAIETADPVARFVKVVRFYLSAFHTRPKGVKKPYNPVLGELFMGKIETVDGTVSVLNEQVSHHPPITATYFENAKQQYILSGHIQPVSNFLGTSVAAHLRGYLTLRFLSLGETYTMTLPSAYASGFILGPLRRELGGKVTVECASSGLKCELEFKRKPMLRGKYNQVSGFINQGETRLYDINGDWTKEFTIQNVSTKEISPFLIISTLQSFPVTTNPLPKQNSFESQKLWRHVTHYLRAGNVEEASKYKHELENMQRAGVRERKERGDEWVPKYFEQIEDGTFRFKNFRDSPFSPEEISASPNFSAMHSNDPFSLSETWTGEDKF
eukprot:c5166_g1_i1.p1 GENE.c5166_g1_i1~~c5166_g1_i1.p1  ORF type:complete len:445 (-),score=95.55 c5166_g1_i1:115-1449(-)